MFCETIHISIILPKENKSMTLNNWPIGKCMLNKKSIIILLIFCLYSLNVFAQYGFEAIPKGFHDFIFGDSLETVKDKLKIDSFFAYRGDPDVSMMLTPDKSIIDTAGSGFIKRAYFIFFEEKLYQITLVMDLEKIDFYTFQTRFTSKYGNPDSLDPTGMIWENSTNRISLEYPLSVKYVDLNVFNSLLTESQLNKSNEEVLREDFINSF